MKTSLKLTTLTVLITHTVSLLSFSPFAFAVVQDTTVGPDAAASVNCSQFCTQFGKDSNAPLGLSESGAWDATDDSICNELGAKTSNASISTDPSTYPSSLTNSPLYKLCNISMGPEAMSAISKTSNLYIPDTSSSATSSILDIDKACQQLGNWKTHCIDHNTQVESHCIAYNAYVGNHHAPPAARFIEGGLAALDAAVVAACGAACSMPMRPELTMACEGVALAATTGEILESIAMGSEKAAGYIELAVEGGGESILAAGLGVTGVKALNKSGVGKVLKEHHVVKTREKLRSLGKEVVEANKEAKVEAAAEEEAEKKSNWKKLPCVSAAIFAAMFGVRIANIKKFKNTGKKECESVQQLLANSGDPVNNMSNTNQYSSQGANTNNSPSGNYGGSSGGQGNGSGTASTGDSYTDYLKNLASACASSSSSPGCIAGGSSNAATDAGILSKTNTAAPFLNSLPHEIANELLKNAVQSGAGPALANALPASFGNLGTALAGAADAGEKDADKIAKTLGMGDLLSVPTNSSYSGGGGSSGRTGSGSNTSENPFANLFGASAGGGFGSLGSGTGVANFGSLAQDTDIWHSNSKDTLFQIISARVNKTSQRIQENQQ